jgi:apolipoprotein D and lipocalin family protein
MAIRVLMAVLVYLTIVTVRGSDPPLRVVDSVDLNRYAGKWFEIARLPNKFQKQCTGDVVVQYAVRPDARVDVINQCRTADGQVEQARGIARKAGDGKNSAVLQVRFAPAILSFLPMVWGDYWIIGLGPDYTWAVVGVPSREYLWILSRTPRLSVSAWEQALEIARGNGFDVSKIVKTSQTN